MGTRGAIGFISGEHEKIAYNHWDSYPEGLGVDTLKFLRECNLDEVKKQAARLLVVDGSSTPTNEQIEELRRFSNLSVSNGTEEEWYCLLRETQGDWKATLEAGVIEDAHDFPLDSLFCEWAYIIDLDHEMLEVYKGFQSSPHQEGRFASRSPEGNRGYYPIKLVAAYPLRELPSDEQFVAQTDPEEKE